MSQLSISVIVPCYNAEEFIGQTLDSILDQAPARVEILVINDGSTDGTRHALEPYAEAIRSFDITNSGGPSRPRNIGIENASGDLIAFCDADDLMLPGKLARAAAIFQAHPDIDFLFTNFRRCDEKGRITVPDFLAEYREFRRDLVPANEPALSRLSGADTYRSLLRANFIGTSSVVCRAEVFASAGNFDETMPNSEDLDLWRRIARKDHVFAFLDEVWHSYRFRSDSISQGGSRMYPALITGFERQRQHCSEKTDLQFIQDKIHSLWLGYGYSLRREGKRSEARAAYRTALTMKTDWSGVKGLLLSALGR